MLGFLGLEIEIEREDRPGVAALLRQRAFDDRPHALEEVVAHRRLGAVEPEGGLLAIVVGDQGSASAGDRVTIPDQILLDRERRARRECAIDPVHPAPVVWVAVVRVEQDARAWRELRPGWRRRQ